LPVRDADAADLALLVSAARQAGQFARARLEQPFATVNKPGQPTPWGRTADSPVTDVDLETNALLADRLRPQRPTYGWLSEETADTPDRLGAERVFIVDPIDGTSALLKRKPEFTIVVCVAERGAPVAAAVFNPLTDEMFCAAKGGGAFLNGTRLSVSPCGRIEGARMLGSREFFAHPGWPRRWPPLVVTKYASLAYRMALVAAGQHDGMLAMTPKHEWDIASGALLIAEAGGLATSHDGQAWTFNKSDPREKSLACAGPALHALLLDHIKDVRIPGSRAPSS
jgi:myo-inositol-1(or 4)-monophosphatase